MLLVLSTWFSGTAVAGSLIAEWGIDAIGLASLTVAVQLGFAVGAVALAALGVPDVLPARWLIATGAVVGHAGQRRLRAAGDRSRLVRCRSAF